MTQRRSAQRFVAPILGFTLVVVLAVILALIIKANEPYFQDAPEAAPTSAPPAPETNTEPPGPEPAPEPDPEPEAPADPFVSEARTAAPSLDPALTDAQVHEAADSICAALAAAPVPDVYYSHEVPVATVEEAGRFFILTVERKCPEHAEEVRNIAG